MRKLVLLLVPLLVLAACAGGTKRDADHNTADIAYVQQMIPHHQQAIDMTDLVPATGQIPELVDLAARIRADQGPEIRQMKSWLEARDLGESDHTDMPGMASDDEMADLGRTTGDAFDARWIELMTEHHRGAAEMADAVLRDGRNSEVRAMAEHVIDHQVSEIAEMEAMR